MTETIKQAQEEITGIIDYLYPGDDTNGHGKEHIRGVLNSLENAVEDFDIKDHEYFILYIAAMFHDCDMSDRKMHHINSAEKFMKLYQKFDLTKSMPLIMAVNIAEVIKQHRSSIPFDTKTRLGQIMTKIDTGYPFDIFKYLDRCIDYFVEREAETSTKFNVDACIKHVKDHLKDKYLDGGYAREELTDREKELADHMMTHEFQTYIHNRTHEKAKKL